MFADDFLGAAINYVAARKRISPAPAEPSFSILRYELIKGTQEDTLEVTGKRVTWKISGETSFQSSFICLFPAPPDAHNKYSIKTFLSKHSCSRSIPKKFPSVNFLLTIRSVKMIEMIFLFSPSTTLLSVRTKNLNIETFVRNSRSLAIIPALEIPLNVESNLLFFSFSSKESTNNFVPATSAAVRRVLDFNGRRWKGNFILFICRLTRCDTRWSVRSTTTYPRARTRASPAIVAAEPFEIHGISRGPC